MAVKCCYCQVALWAVGSQRGWKICSTLLLFSWFERPNVAPHATLSVAPPRSRVPFFRCSLAADTVILPCFRFRKEILGSAVEGTPKGVQKRYARLSNLLCGLSCHQLCFRLSPAKDVFFAQLLNAHGEVNSPGTSTLFVLDSQIFLFMTVTLSIPVFGRSNSHYWL